MLVAAGDFPGALVYMVQTVQPAADQNRMHGRRWHGQLRSDRRRPQPLLPAQVHNPAHQLLRGPVRHPVWAAGSVGHARLTHRSVRSARAWTLL